MDKYEVTVEDYEGRLLKNCGMFSLEQVREIGMELVGSTFKCVEYLDMSLEYIKRKGDELWLCDNNVQIRIERYE